MASESYASSSVDDLMFGTLINGLLIWRYVDVLSMKEGPTNIILPWVLHLALTTFSCSSSSIALDEKRTTYHEVWSLLLSAVELVVDIMKRGPRHLSTFHQVRIL
jgi:hypothetical protein